MNEMPKDPAMLLSWVNTKLRDFYPGIEELCGSLSISRKELDSALAAIDYSYDREKNQYV